MARTIPPSFVEIGPKLRVVALLMWEWPKTAKNRGEPQKMTPSSETEIFFGGGSDGKVVAPYQLPGGAHDLHLVLLREGHRLVCTASHQNLGFTIFLHIEVLLLDLDFYSPARPCS